MQVLSARASSLIYMYCKDRTLIYRFRSALKRSSGAQRVQNLIKLTQERLEF